MTYTDDTQDPAPAGETGRAKRRGPSVRSWAIAGAASLALVGGLAFTKYNQVMAAIAAPFTGRKA